MDFKKIINNLPLDKIAHFGVGAISTACALPFGLNIAIVVLLFLSIGKEVVDSMMGKEFDLVDLGVTLAGGVAMLGWLLYLVPFLL